MLVIWPGPPLEIMWCSGAVVKLRIGGGGIVSVNGPQDQTKYRGHDIQVWSDLSQTGKVSCDFSRTPSRLECPGRYSELLLGQSGRLQNTGILSAADRLSGGFL